MALLEQRNPTLAKVASRLLLAGADSRAPILAGFHADASLSLRSGEYVKRVRVYTDAGFSKVLSSTTTGSTATVSNMVFGTDTSSGSTAVRNFIEWTTNYGTVLRQFYVKDVPTSGGLYVQNQDAQETGGAVIETHAGDQSFSINILPYFADEFTNLHWEAGNSWANVLRSWGGAATAEILLDGAQIIAEQDIADIHGYYWQAPAQGSHPIVARLRAASGSAYYVDIEGSIQILVTSV